MSTDAVIGFLGQIADAGKRAAESLARLVSVAPRRRKAPSQRVNQGKNFVLPAGTDAVTADSALFEDCSGEGELFVLSLQVTALSGPINVLAIVTFGDGAISRHELAFNVDTTEQRVTIPGPLFSITFRNVDGNGITTSDCTVSAYIESVTAQGASYPVQVLREEKTIPPNFTGSDSSGVQGREFTLLATSIVGPVANVLLTGYVRATFEDGGGNNLGSVYFALAAPTEIGQALPFGQFVPVPPSALSIVLETSAVGASVKVRPVFRTPGV